MAKTRACGCPKLPEYGSDDLDFIEVLDGKVHVVLAPHLESCDVVDDGRTVLEVVTMPYRTTWCGSRLRVDLSEAGQIRRGAVIIGLFADERLCAACVRALGADSHRAFEREQPDDCGGCKASRDDCERLAPERCCPECAGPDTHDVLAVLDRPWPQPAT